MQFAFVNVSNRPLLIPDYVPAIVMKLGSDLVDSVQLRLPEINGTLLTNRDVFVTKASDGI